MSRSPSLAPPFRWVAWFVILIASLTAASTAVAASDAVTAEALFRQGRDAMGREDYETACARFEESRRLEPAVGTVMNLAVCSEKLGRIATAWQLWREALDRLPPDDDRREFAKTRLEAIEPQLPYLVLEPPDQKATDLTVLLDGVELGQASLGIELPVDPGEVTIDVRASGRHPWRKVIHIEEGDEKSVELGLGSRQPVDTKAATTAEEPALDSQPRGKRRRIIGLAVGGVGILGIAGGITTGVMVENAQDTVDAECDPTGRCTQEGLDAADRGNTLLIANAVSWGVGIVGVGLGTTLFVTAPRGEKKGARLRWTPTKDGGRLQVEGRF